MRSEHPRVGGEDSRSAPVMTRGFGTPPRRRGGPGLRMRDRPSGRNTPASAGRTCSSMPSAPRSPEHPRVGGEDYDAILKGSSPAGTPPRRRGGRRPQLGRGGCRRNTPASAGRTGAARAVPSPPAEHPRVGGEDWALGPSNRSVAGTPPRRRGGLSGRATAGAALRNTPASAGRTHGPLPRQGAHAEHPRVGGEDPF